MENQTFWLLSLGSCSMHVRRMEANFLEAAGVIGVLCVWT